MGEARLDEDEGRATAPPGPSTGRLVVAFVVSVAVGAGLMALFLKRGDDSGASFAYSEGATHRDLPGRGVELSQGQVLVEAQREVVVLTPDLEVRVGPGRVTVGAEAKRSTVEVAAGTASMLRARASLELKAGDTVGSDDPRLDAPRLPVPAFGDTPCVGPEQQACLDKAAAGSDPAAEDALLRLGFLALDERDFTKALAFADRALAKFPAGARLNESHLLRFEAVSRLHRDDWARREAAFLLEREPTGPLAPWVALAWGDLELRARSWSGAKRAFGMVLQAPTTDEQAAEATYGFGLAELRADHGDAARKAFERALELAPKGPRATDLKRRLGR